MYDLLITKKLLDKNHDFLLIDYTKKDYSQDRREFNAFIVLKKKN